MAKLCERERNCVYSRLFLFSVNVELFASRVGVGHSGDLLFGFSCCSRISSHRFARTSIERDRSENEKNAGEFPVPVSLFLCLPSLFFRARAITLVCEGPLAIGMKVGSCVEMESPGPRLYTHLPTRADGQDRARGPRPSSPIEPPGGASLLVFSSPPFLDSTYLISLLVLYLLLSFSSLLHRFSHFCLSLFLVLARFCLILTCSPISSLLSVPDYDVYIWYLMLGSSRRFVMWLVLLIQWYQLALSELNSLTSNSISEISQ